MARPKRAHPALLVITLIAATALAGCVGDDSSPGANKAPSGPAVTVRAPQGPVAPGEAITLTAQVNAPGDAVLYAWDFGDGAERVGPALTEVEHAYTAPGLHAVTLTVTDAEGAQGHGTALVGVTHTAHFSGRVTSGGGGVGGDAFTASLPVDRGATNLTARLHLEPAEGALSGRVQVRVVAPGNASTPAHAVYEAVVDVPDAGADHAVAVGGDDLRWPGEYRLEVVPREGSVKLDGRARVTYA